MRNTSSRTQKFLVPLAVLLAAGALAVGSGATFSSTTGNSISSVTSGTLSHTNSMDGSAVLELANIKPGDTRSGSLTLINTGSLAGQLSLVEKSSTSTFVPGDLVLEIKDGKGTEVYKGDFGGLEDGLKNGVGKFAPKEERTYTFTVTLLETAGNGNQGKSASAAYTWDLVQD